MRGNYDGGSYVTHFLDSPITLYYTNRLVKLIPKSWHGKPCMRFELIACDNRPPPCQSNPCLNGGECNRNETGDFCTCKQGFTGINCQDYEGQWIQRGRGFYFST
ncbi:protocadherin-like wing polarity stan isoform X3 [Paramuricea clavata]|uniref:Protocadherin-like wing polarity stan isoform X3 n=1 Tax=Paramuricea clavata TaxID=317549 RepID=A0A7D9ITA8_PARCT|nr:protocadherin-like wing polarity stan isoform X3 [Paramuricea clavata]